jgi:hypothetical protein
MALKVMASPPFVRTAARDSALSVPQIAEPYETSAPDVGEAPVAPTLAAGDLGNEQLDIAGRELNQDVVELARRDRFAERLGNVVVNDSTDYWEAHEPFGGASGTQTGWGRIGGRYTMLDMTDLKTVVLDVGGLD